MGMGMGIAQPAASRGLGGAYRHYDGGWLCGQAGGVRLLCGVIVILGLLVGGGGGVCKSGGDVGHGGPGRRAAEHHQFSAWRDPWIIRGGFGRCGSLGRLGPAEECEIVDDLAYREAQP